MTTLKGVLNLRADYLGFIFYPGSSRYCTLDSIPESESGTIGVFVDPLLPEVLRLGKQHKLKGMQLHGKVSPDIPEKLKENGYRVILAKRVGSPNDLKVSDFGVSCVDYFLFDALGKFQGGNGIKFNWEWLEEYRAGIPFFLSGGIGPGDADSLKAISHPLFAGVDLNSRFEIKPGEKDLSQLKKFMHEFRN